MIEVIELSTRAKAGRESLNEDGIFVSDDFVAVVDGATSKSGDLHEGKSGGQVVRDIIIEALADLDYNADFLTATRSIQRRIEREFPADRFFPAAAAAAIYSVARHQLWMVGDCQAMVNGRLYQPKKEVDEILAQARSIAISALLAGGTTEESLKEKDLGRELIMPFLKLQKHLENQSGRYGYLVFNNRAMSDSVLKEKGIVIDIPAGSNVVLASDGYPILKSSLKESEEALDQLLRSDPLCYKLHVSTKGLQNGNPCHDDRTFIKFLVKD